jgi:predicted membrane-bound mannosyltransferase
MVGLRLHDKKIAFWLQAAVIAVIIIVAAFFRFYRIAQIPPGLFPDEATHALDALEVLDGQLTIYSPDEGSTGALWRYLLAVNFALLGPSIFSLRAFSSAVGVLSVCMAYLVVRERVWTTVRGWDGLRLSLP